MGSQQPLLFNTVPTTALGALRLYEVKMKKINEDQESNEIMKNQFDEYQEYNEEPSESDCKFEAKTTTCIMRLARSRLLEMNSKNADIFSIIVTCFGEIHAQYFNDMEISVALQAAAEKVAYKKFSCAKKLLHICNHTAFKTGNPIQRTVFYFAQALKDRIDRQLGSRVDQNINSKDEIPLDVRQTLFSLHPATIAHQQRFNVVAINMFTGIQSILDNVASAKKIHLIDFRIRNGWQWTILMQTLSARHVFPVEHVKITAIGTSKEFLSKTGKWLSSFAKSLELPFSFHIVVSDLKDLREDMFKIEANETVAIFSSVCLFSLVAFPSRLNTLMRVIRKLRHCVFVVNEINQSTNSPNFMERFTKSLFFITALFDCANACAGKVSHRKLAEEDHFSDVIRNIVVAEGTERIYRYEKFNFWRNILRNFRFVESQISSAAICQAKLMVECSPGKNFYNLLMDGKCMTLGWKGTPIEFLSVWKLK